MDMTVMQLIAGGAVFLLAGVLQSTVGFGFSLFTVPMLLLIGIPLPQAVMMTIIGAVTQCLLAVHHLRHAVNIRELMPMVIVGLLALPGGIAALRHLSRQSSTVTRQCIGALILALVLARWLLGSTSGQRVHRAWGYLAATASGFLGGLANIGGPPLILWAHAHTWSNEKYRVTVLAFFLPQVPLQLGLLFAVYGMDILGALIAGLIISPFSLVGCVVGLYLGRRLSVPTLQKLVFSVLALVGAANVLYPLIERLKGPA